MNPKVSVVIPCYNCISTIEQTVLSVINQTYKNIEIILVDDCSTDGVTYQFLNKIKSTYINVFDIKVFKTQKNGGQSLARNTGIANANGSYIAFLDSDDIWLPHKLEWQIDFMEKRNDCFFSGTKITLLSKNDKNIVDSYNPKYKKITLRKLIFRNVYAMSSIVVRNIGNYFFDENVRYSSDFHYLLDILSNNNNNYLLSFVGVTYNDVRSERISSTSKNKQYTSDKSALLWLRKRKKILFVEYIWFRFLYFAKYIRNLAFR